MAIIRLGGYVIGALEIKRLDIKALENAGFTIVILQWIEDWDENLSPHTMLLKSGYLRAAWERQQTSLAGRQMIYIQC